MRKNRTQRTLFLGAIVLTVSCLGVMNKQVLSAIFDAACRVELCSSALAQSSSRTNSNGPREREAIQEKQTRDILSLPLKEQDSLFVSAARYGLEYGVLSDYSFSLYNNGGFIPTPVRMRSVPQTKERPYDRWVVYAQMPIALRKIDTRFRSEQPGMNDLVEVVEQLSAKRADLNFDLLYRQFGWIVRKLLSKSDYAEKYAPTVDVLLIAYDDMQANPKLYDIVATIMQQHWQATLREPYIGLPDYYQYLKPNLSQQVRVRLESYFQQNNTDYENNYMIIWSYSFWLRRKNEGKTEEVYKTLCAIRSDFSIK